MGAFVPERTDLSFLAEPLYSGPEALPEGVPHSLGVIATHHPKTVRKAASEAICWQAEQRSLSEAYGEESRGYEAEAAQELEAVKEIYRKDIIECQRLATETNDINELVKLEEERTALRVHLEQAALDRDVQRAYDKVVHTAVKQLEVDLEVARLQDDADLAQAIFRDYKKLGRRGRIASYTAGVLLTIGAVWGTHELIENVPPVSESYSQASHDETVSDLRKNGYGALPVVFLAGGAALAEGGHDHFARRRAKRTIARARRRASTA